MMEATSLLQMLLVVSTVMSLVAAIGPCDIYAQGGTPCVAAHSMTRALYGSYSGGLYVLQRASDNTTLKVQPVTGGGPADSAAQETFCRNTACNVLRILDQSGRDNHLDIGPPGGNVPHEDMPLDASRLPVRLGNHNVYAAYFDAGMGYRNDNTTGVATGDSPQSMYMVTSGKHYNDGCCFDYGNAETDNDDDGKGTMEAIYFGNSSHFGHGPGNGPWVMADLEKGLWCSNETYNPANAPMAYDFVTAMVKGYPGGFTIKGGNAQSGPLITMYDGPRPGGYQPMNKKGAIVLGIGGDNSNRAIGTFFEGVMVSGLSSNSTDDAVHANVVAAGYILL